jgi:hypothetical protein
VFCNRADRIYLDCTPQRQEANMRKEFLALFLLLIPLSASGSSVELMATKVKMLSNASVRTACNGRVDTACTTFDDARLYCVCALSRNGWMPKVRITAQPRTFLSHSMYQLHELSHIFDFEFDMRRHAAAIESQSFTDTSACEAFLTEQRVSFPKVLQEFVHASMMRRDGVPPPNRQ